MGEDRRQDVDGGELNRRRGCRCRRCGCVAAHCLCVCVCVCVCVQMLRDTLKEDALDVQLAHDGLRLFVDL